MIENLTPDDGSRQLTRAERSRLNRIQYWLKIRREADARLRELGISEDEMRDIEGAAR
ncbi:hypothetical protein [Paenirhodobacter populi]|uniref:hypothetical protein n=1 Tax=Paenirhodobacter populi TaxID=2306993 RepID=UPI0013E373CF|nr:hypothetical protein [Sinirhodobacter populi]